MDEAAIDIVLREAGRALRDAGAKFAFLFGSQTTGAATANSDTDVAAWWGENSPNSWDVLLPPHVDLVVLDTAPLWLAGRVAQSGVVLFDDAPPQRVAWQADTRLRYLDERDAMVRRKREWLEVVAHGR